MSPRKSIEFNLLGNAQDSLRQAIQLLAFNDVGSPQSQLKHAIVNTAHCVELLLKERLRRVNPALVLKKTSEYPSLSAFTVGVNIAIKRLKSNGNVRITLEDEKTIEDLRDERDDIEHYEWTTTEEDARRIVGKALSFVFAFGRSELGIDLTTEFRNDDTWRIFLDELYEFTEDYCGRLQEIMRTRGDDPVECKNCGEEVAPWHGGNCELCGHWQDFEDTE